jgi:hypothetical protein
MISPQLAARIEAAFPEALCARFVTALREAYDTACDNFRPDEGSIPLTFGMDVWAFATFRLRQVANDEAPALRVEVHENRTTLRKNGLFLSCYRVGASASEPISESFPNNQHAAPQLARNNLQLDIFLDGDPDPDAPVDLVLSHLGNPASGLEAVYLCVPTAVENERLSAWGFTKLLWRRGGQAGGTAGSGMQVEPAPEVPIDAPAIRLRTERIAGQE